MKRYELTQVAQFLSLFKRISSIERVDDTIIKILFDRKEAIYFDLRRGDSHIFMCEGYKRAKVYQAPFDILLSKRFGRAQILGFEVMKGNRILRISVNSDISYKAVPSVLQLEFTGRNTNGIILDEAGIVQEALRHIDASVSFRQVRVGELLDPLPMREFEENKINLGDIPSYLRRAYELRKAKRLDAIKAQKQLHLHKKIERLQRYYESLEDEVSLEEKASHFGEEASLVLANLHVIKGYAKKTVVWDFEGNEREIILPEGARTPQEAANMLFSKAKKLRQKAKSLHIERENLTTKLSFWKRLAEAIQESKSEEETHILLPRQSKQQRSERENASYESFFIEGFKIMVGKSEKGNIELLKSAKKSDIWFHLKDRASSHVIIRTDKQNVPESVLEFAGKLCVTFSVTQKGGYLVDYTPRRNVKMNEGAHVTYVEYQTVKIFKE
mgnify:CR=1 FL=1